MNKKGWYHRKTALAIESILLILLLTFVIFCIYKINTLPKNMGTGVVTIIFYLFIIPAGLIGVGSQIVLLAMNGRYLIQNPKESSFTELPKIVVVYILAYIFIILFVIITLVLN